LGTATSAALKDRPEPTPVPINNAGHATIATGTIHHLPTMRPARISDGIIGFLTIRFAHSE
jgi:hypothetical protein